MYVGSHSGIRTDYAHRFTWVHVFWMPPKEGEREKMNKSSISCCCFCYSISFNPHPLAHTFYSHLFHIFSLAFCAEKNMSKYLSFSGNIFSFIFAFGVFAYTYLIHETCLANKIYFTTATSYELPQTDRCVCVCVEKGHADESTALSVCN